MNLIIIILAATVAYFLTEIYEFINGIYAKYQLRELKKKRLKNDLYRFKLKSIYLFALAHFVECGMTRKQAEAEAIRYVIDIDNNDYTDYKFRMIKGNYGRKRNTRSCI